MDSEGIRNKEINKWVFIGGAPRSGTSLLQAILNEHSQCVSPPESHILETFVYAPVSKIAGIFKEKNQLNTFLKNDKWIHRLGINPEEIVNDLSENADTKELFRLYMQRYASRVNKEILIEGAPLNIWFLKKLNDDFPGCFILHIVRDPRDVVMSTHNAAYTKKFDFPTTQVAKQFMESYLQSVRFSSLYGSRYFKIYYEELVSDPEKVIRSICDFIAIKFEAGMLDFHNSSQKVSGSEEVWKENLTKPFLKDNFGKWKNALNQKDLIRIEHICSEFFELENRHYKKSDARLKAGFFRSLANLYGYYVLEVKKRARTFVNWRQTNVQLDSKPSNERLRVNGFLKK